MNAEPYATVEQADAYFNARINSAEWAEFTAEEKPKLLLAASDYIDFSYRFKGSKTDPLQMREFPRTGIQGVDHAKIPDRVIYACCELALIAGNNSAEGGNGLDVDIKEMAEKRVKVDVIEVEYDAGLLAKYGSKYGTGLNNTVDNLLYPFLWSGTSIPMLRG